MAKAKFQTNAESLASVRRKLDRQASSINVKMVAVSKIQPSRHQPRKNFDADEIAQLAASIKAQGLLQPILLTQISEETGRHELVAGERRWRAVQHLGEREIEAKILPLQPDGEEISSTIERRLAQMSLIENIQRSDLTALEIAHAVRHLRTVCDVNQTLLAEQLGMDRSRVARLLKIATLPEHLVSLCRTGSVSERALALLAQFSEGKEQDDMAHLLVAGKLTVRALEAALKKAKNAASSSPTQVVPAVPSFKKAFRGLEASATELDKLSQWSQTETQQVEKLITILQTMLAARQHDEHP